MSRKSSFHKITRNFSTMVYVSPINLVYLSLFYSDSVGIRTQDPRFRRALLYPTELRNQPICICGCKDTGFCLYSKEIRVEIFSQNLPSALSHWAT